MTHSNNNEPQSVQRRLSSSLSSAHHDSRARLLFQNTWHLFFGWRLLSINRSHLFYTVKTDTNV